MLIVYLAAGFAVVLVCFVKSRFWVRQPVRLWWSFREPQVVKGLPSVKYLDHANVRSFLYESADGEETQLLVEYLQTQTNDVYYPNLDHISASFVGAYISVYGEYKGSIVSRPVDVRLDKKAFRGFFHEHMTSDKTDVTRRLIATHGTNLAKAYPEAPSVFFTTSPIFFVLPVLQYEIRWVQTKIFQKYYLPYVSFLKITERNVHLAVEWWRLHPFQFQMVPSVAQLVAWLQSKTASIYLVLKGGSTMACFCFKKTLMVERNKGVMDCCGAIFARPDDSLFRAFSTLMFRVRRTNPIVRLHLVSHLCQFPLVPYFKKTRAYYYLYRYKGGSSLPPSECLVY
jgi:hypothetical protein